MFWRRTIIIARIIFLNLVVNDEKVVSYKMTKAFSKLEKAQNVLNGRVEHTLHELLNSLFEDYSQTVSVLNELKNACNSKCKKLKSKTLCYE